MTDVNVSLVQNTVTVSEDSANVISVAQIGPQGPTFTTSGSSLDDSAKVNNSVVYYSSSSGTFKADATRTVENLVDGGNF